MLRRSWGVVLLTVVIIVAIVAPVWGGRRVPGTAQPIAPQDPPQIGDCLHQMPFGRSALDYLPPLMAALTGPCSRNNVGEIVFVADEAHSFPRTTDNTLRRPEVLACDALMRKYIGWPGFGRGVDSAETGVSWHSWNTMTTALIGPSLHQYLAGQQWVACVAYPEFVPYEGSLAGSVHSGLAANSFASCLSLDDDQDDAAASCAGPHQTELFGWVRSSAARVDVLAACAGLVEQLTGMPDPTAGGLLAVNVRGSSAGGTTSDAGSRPSDGRWSCSVTAVVDRRLMSTLIGLGHQPIPWE